MIFALLAAVVSIVAGGIAALAGFGIGSILTPLVSLETGTQIAVAAVSIPHLTATSVRLWMLRRDVDRRVLASFGILSAGGGLAGALLQRFVSGPELSLLLALLLMFSGLGAVTGYTQRIRFGAKSAWLAGILSGIFGGLVGNQGGIRSAALLGFHLEQEAFVATAAAIALFVDLARVPVYLVTAGQEIRSIAGLVAVITFGTVAGTLAGARVLRRIPEHVFTRLVGILVFSLGLFMCVQAALEQR